MLKLSAVIEVYIFKLFMLFLDDPYVDIPAFSSFHNAPSNSSGSTY